MLNHPDSTFYHQLGWKRVVERRYRHKPYYLLAKENGEIRGGIVLEPEGLTDKTAGLVRIGKIDIDEEIGIMMESRADE